jgi:hypothetical protein
MWEPSIVYPMQLAQTVPHLATSMAVIYILSIIILIFIHNFISFVLLTYLLHWRLTTEAAVHQALHSQLSLVSVLKQLVLQTLSPVHLLASEDPLPTEEFICMHHIGKVYAIPALCILGYPGEEFSCSRRGLLVNYQLIEISTSYCCAISHVK